MSRQTRSMIARKKALAAKKEPRKIVKKTTNARAVWTTNDETVLIRFLLECKRKADENFTFGMATWNAAATRMEQHREKGGVKGMLACKRKWTQVCKSCTRFPTTSVNIIVTCRSATPFRLLMLSRSALYSVGMASMAPILIPGCKTFRPRTSRYACVYSCPAHPFVFTFCTEAPRSISVSQ